MSKEHTFHAGEIAMQQRAGEAHRAQRNVRLVSDSILAGAQPFIAQQTMVVLASEDAQGRVWSSLLFGPAGFAHIGALAISAANEHAANIVSLEVAEALRDASDPVWANLHQHATLGMLFIELATRRRYRVNGQVQRLDAAGLELLVQEAYPNCPKFIQPRALQQSTHAAAPQAVATGNSISPPLRQIISQADTLFVASLNAEAGADASHRGGQPGFVQIMNERVLRIPDYAGNSLFNTLGNIAVNRASGICVPDFNGQQLLQMTGNSRVLWDQEDPEGLTGGSHRFWEFEIEEWILRPMPQQLAWQEMEA
ncbi:pyridoxamine 5'-phosphate oxidase family protein [Methylobacillus glycogenes]|uniref:pyridoxamine 5'-phosphate oxidase family protein n=1 Tax=Methylobacillus glycogenes TaxID=406 RepID=UPI00046F6A85|nr:pyridoxamine 5'-phosphate oxidase family protein [Methylobacillus glycogenes]